MKVTAEVFFGDKSPIIWSRSFPVILARVKRQQVLNNTRIYKVRIRKEYKMSEKAQIALKSGRLLTSDNEGTCGITLQLGKVYAISGHVSNLRAHINLCGMATRWEHLSKRQRKGLKKMYKQGCDCRIDTCFFGCRKRKDACVFPWDRSINDCLAKEVSILTWFYIKPLKTKFKIHMFSVIYLIVRQNDQFCQHAKNLFGLSIILFKLQKLIWWN